MVSSRLSKGKRLGIREVRQQVEQHGAQPAGASYCSHSKNASGDPLIE
jgi:hypothetical protein